MDERTISFFSHEAECSALEARARRLWLAGLVGLALLITSNVAWIWHFLEVVR